MQKSVFYRFGMVIYPARWFIIICWLVVLVACIPFLPKILEPFKNTGFVDEQSQSAHLQRFLNKELKYDSKNKFLIIYHSDHLHANEPLFQKKIKQSLKRLKDFPIKTIIVLPDENKQQIAKDKHTAYVAIIIKDRKPIDESLLKQFKDSIKKPSNMTMQLGGERIFIDEVNNQTKTDLYQVEYYATPAAIITLVIVFGSIIAGMLPIILGGGCALLILITLYSLGHICSLSIFTTNISLLLGLCLSLDYALFIISRFTDELENKSSIREAIAVTEATAGKAILFSGIAVFASLSALFLFPINILFSVAMGGVVAVSVAVLTALIILPAILAVLGKNVNRLSVRFLKKRHSFSIWPWFAKKVVYRPIFSFISVLIILLLLGYPLLHAKFGISDFRIFPEHSHDRAFFDTYSKTFNEPELTPIQMVVKTPYKSIISRKNLSRIYYIAQDLEALPFVARINSIVTTSPQLTPAEYYQAYHLPKSQQNKNRQQLLEATTGQQFTVLNIVSKYRINDHRTKELVQQLKEFKQNRGMIIELTGTPVTNADVLNKISITLPYAILWIMVFTYLILLALLQSAFLPFKAILVNLLSLSASYGALVLVFQEGHLHHLLNFEPQGMVDISLLVIIFCALFGFSMDYEVFLLSRIKESYEENHDNVKSIIFGIEKSGRIITSAALIVMVICGSFLMADVLMVKAFGLGIAVAIAVDAFLIRTILVPATMTLMPSWNWYLPKWLKRIK